MNEAGNSSALDACVEVVDKRAVSKVLAHILWQEAEQVSLSQRRFMGRKMASPEPETTYRNVKAGISLRIKQKRVNLRRTGEMAMFSVRCVHSDGAK